MHGEGVPRITDQVIVLPRVVEILNRWATVTIIRGVSGYGKTTQIAVWLRDLQPAPELIWLDASSSDLRTALSRWLQRHPPASDRTRAPRRVIVLDDAHRLHDPDSVDLIMTVVRRRHDVHVVAASRSHTPLQPAADGAVQMNIVSGRELLFRPGETAALARRLDVPLTAEQLVRLHGEFGGWPAAIRMVLDEMQGGDAVLPLTRAERYLRRSVLAEPADSPLMRRALRFTLAERLTHQLIRDLADDDLSPQDAIDLLESPGYTDVRHLADDVELVLPRFVRRVLRHEFTAAHPQAARQTHRRLALWYASRPGPGHDLYALRHGVAAGDWPSFESVWVRAGASLAASHPAEIEELVRDLPAPVLRRHPSIAVLRSALTARHVDAPAGTRWGAVRSEYTRLCLSIRPASLTRMPLPDMLLVGSGRMMGLRNRGAAAAADALADRLTVELSRRQGGGESAGNAVSWFYLQRGIADQIGLRHADASRWYRLGWHHRRPGDVGTGRSLAAGLALAEALAGRYADADLWIERHHVLTGATGVSHQGADIRIAIASQLAAVDRLDRSVPRLAAEMVHSAADSEWWAFAAYARARRELILGHPVTGLGILDRARADHPDDRGDAGVLLDRVQAELLISVGQGHRALQVLGAADAEDTEDTEASPIFAEPLAWMQLLSGEASSARRTAARALYLDVTSTPDRGGLLLVMALAEVDLGDIGAARDHVDLLVAIATDSGVCRPLALPCRRSLTELLTAVGRELPSAIRDRLAAVTPRYPDAISLVTLTPREKQLVAALRLGMPRDEIAAQMFVSINTVKKQLVTLYRKLGVTTRAGALERLEQLGIGHDDHHDGTPAAPSRRRPVTAPRPASPAAQHAPLPPQARRSARRSAVGR